MHILRHYILHLSHTVQLSLSESEYSRFIIVKLAHGVIYLMIRVSVLPPYLIRSVCPLSVWCPVSVRNNFHLYSLNLYRAAYNRSL